MSELPEETPEIPIEYGSWYFGGVTSTAVASRGPAGCAVQHDSPLVVVPVTERLAAHVTDDHRSLLSSRSRILLWHRSCCRREGRA
jgi:hypothetical protein